jgi:hypothetical protein
LSIKSPDSIKSHKTVNCLSARNSFVTKFMSKFAPTFSSRSVFHMGVIEKYMLFLSIPHHDAPHCSLTVTENKLLMALITATYSRQIINKLSRMDRTARREAQCRLAVHKLITSLHSKRYRPTSMLTHWQNSYAPSSKQSTGHREAQSREPVNKLKKIIRNILGNVTVYTQSESPRSP